MKKFTVFFISLLLVIYNTSMANASDISIYNINKDLLNNFELVKKDAILNAVLLKDISTATLKPLEKISFRIQLPNGKNLLAEGFVTVVRHGGRFTHESYFQFTASKIIVEDGQELFFSAYSPTFSATHPSHLSGDTLALARTITSISVAGGPLTLGTSLGISFALGGFLSAYKNGITDFIWGGLEGAGLSFVEKMLRKQPDVNLTAGTAVPLFLKEDLKMPIGIKKEKIVNITIDKDQALNKIKQLLEWGDLTGAIEYSIKANQKEVYEELFKKISS